MPENSIIDKIKKIHRDDNNQIDISDMVIFPRSSIKESMRLLGAIKRHNGKSIISIEDYYADLSQCFLH